MRDGVAKPRGAPFASGSACLAWRVCNGTRTPPGAARNCSKRDAGRGELMAVGGIDVAIPELRAEAEARGEIEDDVGVRARLAGRRHDRRAKLDQRLRLLADLEADLQRLALEGGGDRQHHVGEFGGRVHEQIGVGVEFQRRERLAPVSAVGMGQQHVRAEADQGADRVRLALQDGPVEIAGGHVAPARRPERALGEPQGRGHCCAAGSSSPVIGAAGGAGNSTLPPGRSKEPVSA